MASITVLTDVLLEKALHKLSLLLGDRLRLDEMDRLAHGSDHSWYRPMLPDAICYPESDDEVSEIVRICNVYKIAIIPYGGGSSVEGQVLPVRAGICIDLSGMNRLLHLDETRMECTLQAGISKTQLNHKLKKKEYVFQPGPIGTGATLGGLIATNNTGITMPRGITLQTAIRSLKMVTPTGQILKTQTVGRGRPCGYDLTRLIIGSEGTLGIVTEVTVGIAPLHAAPPLRLLSFHTLTAAIEALQNLDSDRCTVLEYLDEVAMKAIYRSAGIHCPAHPTILVQIPESETSILQKIKNSNGFRSVKVFRKMSDLRLLISARDSIVAALPALFSGSKCWLTSVHVPSAALNEFIDEASREFTASPHTIFGSPGYGSVQIAFPFNPGNSKELTWARQFDHKLATKALEMGGSALGAYGIGLTRKKHLKMELGEDGWLAMQDLKQSWDPNDIMNPGKIV